MAPEKKTAPMYFSNALQVLKFDRILVWAGLQHFQIKTPEHGLHGFLQEEPKNRKIESYIAELEGVGKERHTLRTDRLQKHSEEEPEDTILFDAAFEANRSRSASGVIVQNQRREMRVLKTTLHSNVSSHFLAEAFACLQAVKLGISLGLRSATIRGDSKTVIKKCQSAERYKSIIGAVINDIKSHSLLFHEISFQFIQKLENYQGHKIAKETLANEDERYLVRDESIYKEGAMKEEWSRNPD
ncbi:hypothetical protein Goklo_022765 [Gossypium klotzschianum]|uniref:RNase H type-1 domain-containing protein n=1 Tax=Gossypium klotzschianum TaxID=34286 RepID=A0A7J8TNE1_9ROSI|nr:hypothetical protein [Gossypium klotzschianum]